MKAEEQILELLAEVLRKQDQTDSKLDVVVQTLQSHQQILRSLATEQQRQGQQLNDLQEATESIARM